MQPLQVTRVDFGDPNFEAFFDLPWMIQGDSPNWVPLLRFQQRKIFNPRKGPFFEFGEAQYFVAWRGDEPVGRISAHLNHNYEAAHDNHTGFFGFFECRDDQEAACALIDAASKWCRERGKTRLMGPLGFGIYDEVGTLIDHFDTFPAIMQVHNPPYYPVLLDNCGLEKAVDWLALRGLPDKEMRPKFERILEEFHERTGLRIVTPKISELFKRPEEVRQLFNETWKNNWGHVPYTKKQFDDILSELRPMMRAKFTRAIYDEKKNVLAGFMFTIPSLNPALKVMNGRITPRGVWRMLKDGWLTQPKQLRTVLMGVNPDYQTLGLHKALFADSFVRFMDTPGLEWWDISLIVETNKPIIWLFRSYKAPIEQKWRIYEKGI